MQLPSYLSLSRHNVYYYRFPLPKEIHPNNKSSHIRLSLKTHLMNAKLCTPLICLRIMRVEYYATKRTPYKLDELDELQTLFTCPIYTGCKGQSTTHRLKVGDNIYQDYLYWIPLIGLYSGMRLNEICQLLLRTLT